MSAPPTCANRTCPELVGHLPALDGIRGLAILMVMVYHLTLLPGDAGVDRIWAAVAAFGWAGVDLFFVLSGFLITGILWEARGGPPGAYFRNFYARRTLRIFPLYYAVMVLLLVVLPRLPHPQAARYGAVGGEQVWYWTYLSNFAIGLRHEWNLGSLDVSWSLAIEEQFYLVWPAVVLLLGRRALMGFCAAVVAAAVLCRTALTLSGGHPIAISVLTPCRMDALAVGAFLALAVRGPGGVAALVSAPVWGPSCLCCCWCPCSRCRGRSGELCAGRDRWSATPCWASSTLACCCWRCLVPAAVPSTASSPDAG